MSVKGILEWFSSPVQEQKRAWTCSKLDSNLDLMQSKLTLFVIIKTITLIECLIYARFYTMHPTFIDPLILLMILQSRFYYLLYNIENETKEQRFRNVPSLQDSKGQDWSWTICLQNLCPSCWSGTGGVMNPTGININKMLMAGLNGISYPIWHFLEPYFGGKHR